MSMREQGLGAAEENPRGFVVSGERERILAAMAAVVSQAGDGAMTLLDVAIEAEVKLEKVLRYCPDKETGFLAAYDAAVWQGIERVLAAVGTGEGFSDRIWAGWRALIDFIVAEPAFGSMCIVDVLEVGPAGIERRNTTWRGFAAVIDQIAEESLPAEPPRPPSSTCRSSWAGSPRSSAPIWRRGASGNSGGRFPPCTMPSSCPTSVTRRRWPSMSAASARWTDLGGAAAGLAAPRRPGHARARRYERRSSASAASHGVVVTWPDGVM